MKKLLASVLSLALITSLYVVTFAETTDPYATVVVKELEKSTYETVMADYNEDTLADGEKAYEVSVSLNNLPDLQRGGASASTGVRLGASSVTLFIDNPSNIVSVTGMDTAMDEDNELPAEKFGLMEYASSFSELDSALVTAYTPGTEGKSCFPTKSSQEELDVDGTLTDAFVFYVVTKGPVKITSIKTDVTISRNGDMVNVTLTKNTQNGLSIAIGEADEPVTPPVVDETKTVGFATTVDYVAGKTGVKFFITTDDAAATVKTKEVEVKFGSIIESKTTGIKMGVNVNNVPETVGLSATAELY